MKEYFATLDEAAWGGERCARSDDVPKDTAENVTLADRCSRPNRSCALILDGTLVRIRLDRKATAISLLVVGVRADGQQKSSRRGREHRAMQPITEQRKVEGDRLIGNRKEQCARPKHRPGF